MDKTKLRLNISANKAEIQALKDLTDIRTNQELIENALILFAWAIKQRSEGNKIASINKKDDELLYSEVIIPSLERVPILS